MKLRLMLGVVVFVGGTMLALQSAVAKDKKSAQASKKKGHDHDHDGHGHEGHEGHGHDGDGHGEGDMNSEMMEMWMKSAMPGEHHQHLQQFVGNWNYVIKWRMGADAPWEKSTGEAVSKMIMDGRFLAQDVRGESMGMVFQGRGTIGYDNLKKKYVSTWIDNMGTMIGFSEGTCDGSGKVFTYQGKMDDLMTGKKDQPYKSIVRVLDDSKHKFEWFATGPDGKMFKSMEISYNRK